MPNCFLNTAARHWYIQVSVAIGFFIAYARLQHNISFFFSISQLFFQFRLAPNLLMFCIFCYLFPWKDNATHHQHFVADVCPVVSICHCANYHLQLPWVSLDSQTFLFARFSPICPKSKRLKLSFAKKRKCGVLTLLSGFSGWAPFKIWKTSMLAYETRLLFLAP